MFLYFDGKIKDMIKKKKKKNERKLKKKKKLLKKKKKKKNDVTTYQLLHRLFVLQGHFPV